MVTAVGNIAAYKNGMGAVGVNILPRVVTAIMGIGKRDDSYLRILLVQYLARNYQSASIVVCLVLSFLT